MNEQIRAHSCWDPARREVIVDKLFVLCVSAVISSDELSMLALSIRQPFAELILRGVKTAELRSRATRIVGERFYIYASRKKWSVTSGQWPVKTADNIV